MSLHIILLISSTLNANDVDVIIITIILINIYYDYDVHIANYSICWHIAICDPV